MVFLNTYSIAFQATVLTYITRMLLGLLTSLRKLSRFLVTYRTATMLHIQPEFCYIIQFFIHNMHLYIMCILVKDLFHSVVQRFQGNLPLNPSISRSQNNVRFISQDAICSLGGYRQSTSDNGLYKLLEEQKRKQQLRYEEGCRSSEMS